MKNIWEKINYNVQWSYFFFFLFEENLQEIKHVQISTILRKSSLTSLHQSLSLPYFLFTSKLFSSVQFSSSVVSDSWWPHEPQHTRPPCPHQLLEFTQTHVHWVGDANQPSHPLSSPTTLALNLSQHQGIFQWICSLDQMAKILELWLQHQSSNEYSGLISFRMDWLDLLAVQGTLKSLLQYHSSKASILRCSAFFIVQLSHLYMTLEKP